MDFSGPRSANGPFGSDWLYGVRIYEVSQARFFEWGDLTADVSATALKDAFGWMIENRKSANEQPSPVSKDEEEMLSGIEEWLSSGYGAPELTRKKISVAKVAIGYSWRIVDDWIGAPLLFNVWNENLSQGFYLVAAIEYTTIREARKKMGREY